VSTSVEELERINQDLRTFVHYASHDLQEPIRAVAGYSRLLAQQLGDASDPEAQYLLGKILLATSSMSTLLKDLLDYSTLGDKRFNLESVNSADIVQKVRGDLAREIADSDARIERGELPWVTADAVSLRLLFRCLLSNAIKFRRGSHPCIHIGARPGMQGVQFWVRDDGIGVPPEYHEEVFKPFRRLHTLDEFPGRGLGLAMARRILERYASRIWLESNEVFGVTVYFELPRGEKR
jgi:histidine kinase